jgi:hypothetical protein
MVKVREAYDDYKWSDIVQHPAVILIPYQVSTMFFFELYRTSTPIFAPSVKLLAKWSLRYDIMWERVYGTPKRHIGEGMTNMSVIGNPNTNDELEFWLAKCDFYVFPHIVTFDSWEDLMVKLDAANLRDISSKMSEFNEQQRVDLQEKWRTILDVAKTRRQQGDLPDNFDEAMSAQWDDYLPLAPDRPIKMQDERCQDLLVPLPSRSRVTDQAVHAMFDAVLGRNADSTGLEVYGTMLEHSSKDAVQMHICNSPEHKHMRKPSEACRLYCKDPSFRKNNAWCSGNGTSDHSTNTYLILAICCILIVAVLFLRIPGLSKRRMA